MKAYNLFLSWVFQAKVFIFVIYAIIYGCCAAILNHMVEFAYFILGPHVWWRKIARHFDRAYFGELLQLTKICSGGAICMFNCVFYAMARTLKYKRKPWKICYNLGLCLMPSSLPLLHTAMPTPCLNTFCIAIPTSFITSYFCGYFFLSLTFSEDRQLHAATTTSGWSESNSCELSGAAEPVRSGDPSASFPVGKPFVSSPDSWRVASLGGMGRMGSLGTILVAMQCMPRVAMFAHAHNSLKWRPIPRQLLEYLVVRLMRAVEVTKILWYRGRSRWKMQPIRGKSTECLS